MSEPEEKSAERMSARVRRHVDGLRARHERHKAGKYGMLVRPMTLAIGWMVVLVGLITIPFPGPGWLTVFIGIGILSLELAWPLRVLHWAIDRYEVCEDWWGRQSNGVRLLLSGLMLLLIWVVFIALAVFMWQLGMLDWARPLLEPVMVPLITWFGMTPR